MRRPTWSAPSWMQTWRKGSVSDITYTETYERPIKCHLIPYFGSKMVDDILPLDIQRFFNIKSKNYALESLKKMKYPLYSIFQSAIENGFCRRNPVTKTLRLHSDKPNITKSAWSNKEWETAYAFSQTYPGGEAFLLLLETGISRSELLGLRKEDIRSEENAIAVCGGIVGTRSAETGHWELQRTNCKNIYRQRKVPITNYLTTRLLDFANQTSGEYLFPTVNGKPKCPDNWYKRDYKPWLAALLAQFPEIKPISPHEIRHTRATLWAYQGVDLWTVARLLGHCDLSMLSKRYLHDDLDAMRSAIGL